MRQRTSKRGPALPGRLGGLHPWVGWLIVSAAALAVLLLVGWGLDSLATGDRIHPGVRLGGVPVGGMTRLGAGEALTKEYERRRSEPVTVRGDKRSWTVTGAELDASLDASLTVTDAWRYGRGGFLLSDGIKRAAAWLGMVDIAARVDADGDKLLAFVEKVEGDVAVPAKDATAAISGMSVRIVSSKPGIAVHRGMLRRDVLAALASSERTVEVVTNEAPVRVRDDDALPALEQARVLFSGPATVVFGRERWRFEPSTVVGWIGFRQVPYEERSVSVPGDATETASARPRGVPPRMKLEAYIVPERLRASLAPHTKGLGRPARNAEIIADEGKVTIKDGVKGTGPDVPALAEDLRVAMSEEGSRSATLRATSVDPAITTEKAKAFGIKERLSKYTTNFAASNKPRVNNIHTLAKALDKTMIPPGGVFSFNKRIGPRTAAKGYQEAPAIVDGKLEPQLGGGICQVGTTIFNSVFLSGLPVLERKNHSFFISHYPKGRDCTVSWGGPDFKFRNDTDHWIMIRASYTSGSLTVSLYGTSPGYKVEYETTDFAKRTPFKTEVIKDPKLLKGKKVVEDPGVEGGEMTVVRTVYLKGKVVRRDTFVSKYKPKSEVVRVGTKEPSVPATSTPTP